MAYDIKFCHTFIWVEIYKSSIQTFYFSFQIMSLIGVSFDGANDLQQLNY